MVSSLHEEIPGAPFSYEASQGSALNQLAHRVATVRAAGRLTPDSLRFIRNYFRIKNIYHSNAIEGNQLSLGETRIVVQQGLTISGKPLKDSAEARNLAHALDFFEQLSFSNEPFNCVDIRQIHSLILKGIDDENAGKYREIQVEISGSAFSPPEPFEIGAKMDEFCAWLQQVSDTETEVGCDPIVLAAAAHAWFVNIHPFIDGNGRTARLVMNLILMRFGYPIAVITNSEKKRYYEALEESQSTNLTPFIALVAESVTESLEEYEKAVQEQTHQFEWAQSIVAKFTEPQRIEASNHYQVWKSAMELLQGYFRQTIELINAGSQGFGRIYFNDFGLIELEKYLSLRDGRSTKRTWFFRVNFTSSKRAARYLFFFGSTSQAMSNHLIHGDRVSLHVATETDPYLYERLDNIDRQDLPFLREIAYASDAEDFAIRKVGGVVIHTRAERIVQDFVEEVIKRNFS